MLGVEFEKIKNVTFLIYNEGTFFSKKDLQLHSSFKATFLKELSFENNINKYQKCNNDFAMNYIFSNTLPLNQGYCLYYVDMQT